MKKLVSLGLAAILAVSLFAGCGQSGTSAQSEGTAYPGTSDPESITVNLGGEPPTLFNLMAIDSYSGRVISHLMDMLIMQDKDGVIVPSTAQSWEYDENTLTYTFHLKKGNTWTNGDEVTAHDFEFGWKSLLNPAFAAPYAYSAYIIKNGEAYNNGEVSADEVGVKALDDYTLQVQLEQPCAYALSQFASTLFAPLNKAAYEKITAQYGANSYGTDADKVVTNGPYTVTQWTHEDQLVLEKNAAYTGESQVQIPKITFRMISDANTALNEFEAGELDFIPELTGDQAEALRAKGANVQSYDTAGVNYLDYSMDWPGLDNAKIRKALSMSIDAQSLCDNVLKNSSKPAYSMVPASITEPSTGKSYAARVGAQFSYDPEKAKQLLAEGLAEKNMTAADLKLSLICDDKDEAQRVAAFLQEQWKQNLGIQVEINAMPYKSRINHLVEKDFCMVLDGWLPDYNDPNTYLEIFITGNGNNAANYTNSEYDALMKQAAAEQDENARYELLAKAEKLLIGTDMGCGPLYYLYRDYIVSDKVDGAIVSAFQNTWRYASIHQ